MVVQARQSRGSGGQRAANLESPGRKAGTGAGVDTCSGHHRILRASGHSSHQRRIVPRSHGAGARGEGAPG
jgi:hypothetical protein